MSTKRTVAKNIVSTLVTQLLSWALAFLVTLYLPRYLGAANMGKLSSVYSLVSITGVFVALGTSTVLIKEIARDRSRAGVLVASAVTMRVPFGIASTLLALTIAHLLGYDSVLQRIVVIGAIGVLVNSLNDAIGSALQGLENMTRMNAIVVTEKFLSAVLTIAAVFLKAPLWAFIAVGLACSMISLSINVVALKAAGWRFGRPSRADIVHLIKEGMPYFGWYAFVALYGQTDPIVLRMIASDKEAGYYAVAFRLIGTTMFIPAAIASALLPTLSRLYSTDREQFDGLARRALTLIMFCAMPVAAVLIVQPELVLRLIYRGQFLESAPVLRVGGLAMLLWYATSFFARLVVSCDRQQSMVKTSAIAAVVGIPACFLGTYLTHRFWGNGAIGAMASDVALEIYLLVVYLHQLPENTFGRAAVIQMLRFVGASAPVVVLLSLTYMLHLGLWVVIPCTLAYFGACWLLKCLTPDDIRLLRQTFARKVKA
ncbi:polysaccharide biosynthesis protein [Capsulimonas corticalis]|uniref:Polysaccharide biosynthesis protein n=1 Tax=Capsulimonas corticalis TaxID=2219043 RepID=A0A402D1T4_9BACT|nr:flippase [Capsulimonas corticalis]BDI28731.1 polysaccharide biosynthesis protein [Capsulimonas corticalis]